MLTRLAHRTACTFAMLPARFHDRGWSNDGLPAGWNSRTTWAGIGWHLTVWWESPTTGWIDVADGWVPTRREAAKQARYWIEDAEKARMEWDQDLIDAIHDVIAGKDGNHLSLSAIIPAGDRREPRAAVQYALAENGETTAYGDQAWVQDGRAAAESPGSRTVHRVITITYGPWVDTDTARES